LGCFCGISYPIFLEILRLTRNYFTWKIRPGRSRWGAPGLLGVLRGFSSRSRRSKPFERRITEGRRKAEPIVKKLLTQRPLWPSFS
jgi:hypothetical protein